MAMEGVTANNNRWQATTVTTTEAESGSPSSTSTRTDGELETSITTTSTSPDGELATSTTTTPTDPVDALLLGTRWTRETVELVLDGLSAVASVVLAYAILWGDS